MARKTPRPDPVPSPPVPAAADRGLLLAFVASGVAALGYEVLWTRLFALALGSEVVAVLGVLAGFFGGLALGGWWGHGLARRSPVPAKTFFRLEAFAAAYALASPWWCLALADALPRWLGPVAGNNAGVGALLLTTAVSGLLLLPATACLGATLAVLVAARRQRLPEDGRGLARLYAANTLGATGGVFVTLYALLPALGFAGAAAVLAGCGLLAGVSAWRWAAAGQGPSPVQGAPPAGTPPEARRFLLVAVFGTGLLGVGLEVVLVQSLGRLLENTVYTFANLLGVYLLGTASGAWLWQRWAPRGRTGALLGALTAAALLAALVAGAADGLLDGLAPEGASMGRHLAAELLLAALVFVPPTLVMGAVFADLVGRFERSGVGRAYAWNTLGGTLAPLVFGLGLLEPLGSGWALRAVLLGYAALALAWTWRETGWTWRVWPPAALGLFGAALIPGHPPAPPLARGTRVIEQRESLAGAVWLLQPPSGEPELLVGRRFLMGGGMSYAEQRMGHLPLLMVPDARRVLFLGVGSGATAGAALAWPGVEAVDAVELHPDIVDLLPRFASVNGNLAGDPRATVHAADARRFAAAVREPYDLVVGDLFHPGRDGAGNLYTLEHFARLRDRVAPGGLVAQWVPLHEFDPPTLQLLVRTFLAAFGDAHAWLGYYNTRTPLLLLVGSGDPAHPGEPRPIDLVALSRGASRFGPAGRAVDGDRDALTGFVAERAGLEAFAGPGPLHTDRHPRLGFRATRAAYAGGEGATWASLFALWAYRTPLSGERFAFPDSARLAGVLEQAERGREALDLYLQADRIWNASGYGPIPREALDLYRQANRVDPGFAPARGVLSRAR